MGATGRAIFNPTVGGLAGKAARFATSPSSIVAGVAYYMWPDGKERTTPPPVDTKGPPGGGDKGMTYKKQPKVLTSEERKAFAESQREARVNKYLDMMGYGKAQKNAAYDALIDASKIITDRGNLKGNVTGEVINPIIQAASARFNKPEQIREAVGLMATKADIEKDLEDPQVKRLRALQIEKGEQELGENFETDMRNLLLSRKDKVNKTTLEQYARLTADKYGEPFTVVTADTDMTTLGDGIYMSESKVIRIKDGVPKQIV